jgi:hypothetical protein
MARFVQLWQQHAPPGGDGLISVWRCYDLTPINVGTDQEDAIVGNHMNTVNSVRPAGFNRNGCFFVENTTGARITGVVLRFFDHATGQAWDSEVNVPKGRSVYTVSEFAAFTANSPSGSYTNPDQYSMNPLFSQE